MIILLGQPGAGKGSVAKLLAKKLNYTHIDTGQLIRTHATKEIKKYMQQGKLLPTKLILPIIKKHLKKKCILDGFPRNIAQAKLLPKPEYIFYLMVEKSLAHQRLLKRAKIEHRTDDTEQVIKKRFKEYEKKTKPLLKFYKPIKVDGNLGTQKLLKQILTHIRHD